MTTKSQINWKLSLTLPDEHRIFEYFDGPVRNTPQPRYAIADLSGNTPEDTDDGILWLDFERALMVNGRAGDDYCSIPLVSPSNADDGQGPRVRTRTPTDVATMLLLSATYNWPIHVARDDMRVDADYKVTT